MLDSLALKADSFDFKDPVKDAHDGNLIAKDPFAKDPFVDGLHSMNAQGMESGEVLPRGEMSCWSASSESLAVRRRRGWSTLRLLFKRSR